MGFPLFGLERKAKNIITKLLKIKNKEIENLKNLEATFPFTRSEHTKVCLCCPEISRNYRNYSFETPTCEDTFRVETLTGLALRKERLQGRPPLLLYKGRTPTRCICLPRRGTALAFRVCRKVNDKDGATLIFHLF